VSAEAHRPGEDLRARAALHRSRATDLRKRAEIEEAWAAELDGEVRAASSTSDHGRDGTPLDVPDNDVSLPPAPLPAERLAAGEIKSWGPAVPSTIDVYLDRWTDYFATDPCWYNIVCALKKRVGSEPDPTTHHVFCRRLAAAVAPMFVAASGADPVQSWGPAPPSTSGDYATTWGKYIAALFAQARAGGSATHGPPSREQAPVIPPPPLSEAPPRALDAEAPAILPTVTPSPATPSKPAPPQPSGAEAAATPLPVASVPTIVAEANTVPPVPPDSSPPAAQPRPRVPTPAAPSPRGEAPPRPHRRRSWRWHLGWHRAAHRPPSALVDALADAVAARLAGQGQVGASTDGWYDQDSAPIARRAYLDACRKGELRKKRIGKSVLVKRADFDAWIEAHGGPERRPAEAPPLAPAEPTTDDLLRSAGIVLRAPTGKVRPPVTTPQRRGARRPK